MTEREHYIPAFGHRLLTPFYDRFIRLAIREEKVKRAFLRAARIESGHKVLDLGCGTGTLAIMLKQLHPNAQVTGLDGDRGVLEIARKKGARAGVDIQWEEGVAYSLPYVGGTFDRVLSTFVFHHMGTPQKMDAIKEVHRVLRAGGEFHLLDLGKPKGLYAKLVSLLLSRLERAADHIKGRLPDYVREGGFAEVHEPMFFQVLVGTVRGIAGTKPM
ncbi:MAG: class I SAM-dependent methyltransferase [Candidatus Tectomicrobia bacterium]|uniref:Class I SAM-dependent methyltransferase n=1 Tax=Tectimicrobiota bacterium TaxID=2528274 RepID=A0A932LZT0_UNCTE|nr:class I SAM-dependent methyltransferase [Candidatus Tectomicrobia bacterium]